MDLREKPTVRNMRFWDLEKVLEIERSTFPTPWDAEIFLKGLRNTQSAVYLVMAMPGRLGGYIGADIADQEGHITNLAVSRDQRRKGFGSLLLIECMESCLEKGARWMTLEVREGNKPALGFYTHFGFEVLGVKMGYYYDTGENAVLMATGDIRMPDYRKMLYDFKESIGSRRRAEAGDL
ncbi:MAG: ribosomal protein S18-alanine N-acetyltransferase [Actinobacteria bacterium]|nr:ribosomal protein S18-alanine N-acetyltransferase [Actinomycetota bacterium]